MTPRRDLTTQLVLAMMAVVVLSITLSVIAFDIVYFVSYKLGRSDIHSLKDLYLTRTDILILAGSVGAGVSIASVLAVRIANRILRPLHSVEQALRRITNGDLSARASPDEHAPREAAGLIDDFNTMASRLERASKNISTWNAQIAHELRTPLTILNGRLQGVVDGVFTADDRMIANLLLQVAGLNRLVEDLRVVSLADSGHLDLQLEPTEPAREIRTLVEMVQPSLAEAGFTISVDADDGEALLDSSRIRQALLALVENARVHAPPGNVHVRATLTATRTMFEVTDEGPGLSQEFVPTAFRQFERAAISKERKGSGLGLSVVQAIAQAHGGLASFSSDQGRSTFKLDLPRWGAVDHAKKS